jgi:hypothetical protein
VLADISEFDALDDKAFCQWLAKDIGEAAVPGVKLFQGTGQASDPVSFECNLFGWE